MVCLSDHLFCLYLVSLSLDTPARFWYEPATLGMLLSVVRRCSGRKGALLRSSCWHYFFYLFFIQLRLHFTTQLQVVLGTVQISSLYSEEQLGVFGFYCAANRSDVFVRGWSAPNTLRRMLAASVNICFAALFFPIALKTRPMFSLDAATSGDGLGRKL